MKVVITFLRLLSYLPFGLLRPFYWLLYLIGVYILSYRKEVISNNLKNSFPELSKEERNKIHKGFYKHFFEFMIEYVKMIKGDEAFFKKHISIHGLKEMQDDLDNGNHVVLAMGHHGNWEYSALYLSMMLNSPMTGIYKLIRNKSYNELMLQVRGKFGLKLLETKEAPREMIRMKNKPACHLFIMDQSPMRSQSNTWINFMNQDTLVYEGVEKMSKMLNAKVYWLSVDKKDLGTYDLTVKKIVNDIKSEDQGNVIRKCYTELSKDIHRQPETWLWSHKRWKHQRN